MYAMQSVHNSFQEGDEYSSPSKKFRGTFIKKSP